MNTQAHRHEEAGSPRPEAATAKVPQTPQAPIPEYAHIQFPIPGQGSVAQHPVQHGLPGTHLPGTHYHYYHGPSGYHPAPAHLTPHAHGTYHPLYSHQPLHHPHPQHHHYHPPHHPVPWIGILFGSACFVVLMFFLLQAVHRSSEERTEYKNFIRELQSNPYREDPHQQLTTEEMALTRTNQREVSYTELSPAALARYIQNNLLEGEDEYVQRYWARIFNHMLGNEYARAERLLRQSYLFEHASPRLRKALRVLEYKVGQLADADPRNSIRDEEDPQSAQTSTTPGGTTTGTPGTAPKSDPLVAQETEGIEVIRPSPLPSRQTPLEKQSARELAEFITAYLIENPKNELVQFTWMKALEAVRENRFAEAQMHLTHANFVDQARGELKEALDTLKRKLMQEIH